MGRAFGVSAACEHDLRHDDCCVCDMQGRKQRVPAGMERMLAVLKRTETIDWPSFIELCGFTIGEELTHAAHASL